MHNKSPERTGDVGGLSIESVGWPWLGAAAGDFPGR